MLQSKRHPLGTTTLLAVITIRSQHFGRHLIKEKLLAMQAQVLQGRMQSNTVSPHSMELAKVEVPTGPVKRQVAEAWNRQRNKRSSGTPELERKRQHKDIKTLGICQYCEHYGRPCL